MNRFDAGSICSQSSSLLRGLFRTSFLLVALLLLSSCIEKDDSGRIDVIGDQTSMSFVPPTVLQARNIVRENLVVEVIIDGQTYVPSPTDGEDFVLQITRPANSSATVAVVWSEDIGDVRLPLARASKLLSVGSEASPATLVFREFDTSQDDLDEDGYDNYTERSSEFADSYADPLVPDSPPVLVNLDVRLALPQALANASEEIREAADAKAEVNGQDLELTREGNVWIGQTTVVQGTSPLLTVNFFDTAERRLELAYYEQSEEVGAGATFSASADAYETDANLDGDAFTNIVEIVNGTDPRDSSDPSGPVADAGADVTITVGASVTLNGSGSSNGSNGTISTYRWTEEGDVLGTGVSLQVPGLTVGDHEIELTVTDNLGLTGSDTVVVTVTGAPAPNQAPVANAGVDQTIASGATVTLNGGGSTDTDGTISAYRWFEGDLSRGTGQSISIIGLSDGVHVITLEVTDNDGAKDTDTVTVTVTAAPVENQPPTANAGADRTIVAGESVTLNGNGSSDGDGTISAYRWSESSAELGNSQSVTIDDLDVGRHVITLEVTDNDGDSDTDTVTVTVTAAPEENQPPTANAGADQTIESGEPVTLDGSDSTDDGTIQTYQWSDDTGDLDTGETLTISDLDTGVHVFTLEVTDNDGDSDTDTVTVTVTAAPEENQPPTANAGDDQTIESGESVTLDGSDSTDDGTIQTYQWSDDTGSLGAEQTLEISDLDEEGEYLITLEVTDDDGDSGTDTVTITVIAASPANLAPIADAGTDQTIEVGDPVTLDGSASSDDVMIASYDWYKDDALLISGAEVEITGLNEGAHVFELLVTDNEGATDTDLVGVTVLAAEEPDDDETPDDFGNSDAGGAKTSATGEFVTPIRTLA